MIVGVAFGVPAWLGLKLQAWTGKKDFYEVCLETVVGLPWRNRFRMLMSTQRILSKVSSASNVKGPSMMVFHLHH